MTTRIEVAYREGIRDVPGEKLKTRLRSELGKDITVRVVDVYTIDADLNDDIIEKLRTDVLVDPVLQEGFVHRPVIFDADWVIEVGFKPGVTDNVGRTAHEVIEAVANVAFREDDGVYTSRMFFLQGILSADEIVRVSEGILANTLINRYTFKNMSEYRKNGGMGTHVPKVTAGHQPSVGSFDLTMEMSELVKINRERTWALSEDELTAIRGYFRQEEVIRQRRAVGLGAEATDVEMEALAQTWSEHCKHKIFNAMIDYEEDGRSSRIDSLFKTYIAGSTNAIRKAKGKSDFCLSVFKDNSGIIKFNNKYNLAYKVETHNTPSALDPYGGALTGIVGVNRDPFGSGKGARLLFNTDVFCFAPPDFKGSIPPRLLHPRRVLDGVREGVEHGGNKSGIPTVNGSLLFDESFLGKPLVYCGTCGIMPALINGEPSYEKKVRKGDYIVMCGGRIGKDGIHGATFSSEELSEASPTSAVQIGDPITQKRMTDFLLIARDEGLYNSITDDGAGGLSSSIGEMADDTNGCIVELEKAPLKYHGLDPWEILLSEAQERMTLSIGPDKIDRFLDLSRHMGVLSTILGTFTDSGKFHVLFNGKTVAYLDMEFLHRGLPRMNLKATWERMLVEEQPPEEPKDYESAILTVLGRWNVCSKQYVVRQYDHEVQAGSVVKPLTGRDNDGPTDAAVVRPDLTGFGGVVVSHGICPKYSRFDAYHMAACAVDEAVRNNIASGGSLSHMALLDNFCWCDPVASERNPDGEYKLAQLVRANQALFDYTVLFGTPLISGKDSMKNDYVNGGTRISIPPTLLVSAISAVRDVRKSVTMDFKSEGDLIIVVGKTYAELAGSEYFSGLGLIGNMCPKVDGELALKIYKAVEKAMKRGLVRSAHDVSDGGLAVALAESAFAGGFGADIDCSAIPQAGVFRDDYLLFSESQSRFVLTIRKEHQEQVGRLFKQIPHGIVGKVTKELRLRIQGIYGTSIIDSDVMHLKEAWLAPFKNLFG
jgi:phosphoribosylformylglycinamidine synthase subunit PurSL